MPRKPHIESSIFPFSISVRCINKDWFDLPAEDVWDILSDQLYFCRHAFNLRIHSFVLMGNHFHILLSTPDANLSNAMAYFLRESSREISRRTGRINRTFSDRFSRTLIADQNHLNTAYKYIYRNPVKAGRSLKVESYPFSTLSGLLGLTPLRIPLEADNILFGHNNLENVLVWLNTDPTEHDYELVRRALKKKVFKFPKKPKGRGFIELENKNF